MDCLCHLFSNHGQHSYYQASGYWWGSITSQAWGRDFLPSGKDSCFDLHHHYLWHGPWCSPETMCRSLQLWDSGMTQPRCLSVFTNTSSTMGNILCVKHHLLKVRQDRKHKSLHWNLVLGKYWQDYNGFHPHTWLWTAAVPGGDMWLQTIRFVFQLASLEAACGHLGSWVHLINIQPIELCALVLIQYCAGHGGLWTKGVRQFGDSGSHRCDIGLVHPWWPCSEPGKIL